MQLLSLELSKRERMAVFFVTHHLEGAVFLSTRILVLSQYYRGAKIIADYQLPRAASATHVKRIRREGFDPANRRHVAEFNLKHPQSVRTLTAEESRAMEP